MAITESGPTSAQVAKNIERARKARHLKQKDLSDRLRAVGRPTLPTVVSKVERGERRIDVDDLVAFALALNMDPTALLLPPREAGAAQVTLTPNVSAPIQDAWRWVRGVTALPETPGGTVDAQRQDDYERLSQSAAQFHVTRSRAGQVLRDLTDVVEQLILGDDQDQVRWPDGVPVQLERARSSLDRLRGELTDIELRHNEALRAWQTAGENDDEHRAAHPWHDQGPESH